MRQVLGGVLIAWPFAAILGVMAYEAGIWAMLAVLVGAGAVIGSIIVGVNFLLDY